MGRGQKRCAQALSSGAGRNRRAPRVSPAPLLCVRSSSEGARGGPLLEKPLNLHELLVAQLDLLTDDEAGDLYAELAAFQGRTRALTLVEQQQLAARFALEARHLVATFGSWAPVLYPLCERLAAGEELSRAERQQAQEISEQQLLDAVPSSASDAVFNAFLPPRVTADSFSADDSKFSAELSCRNALTALSRTPSSRVRMCELIVRLAEATSAPALNAGY